tara:strand:+ start:1571 stop:2026 length:456 start_codon:yes stop_codon:yes gene_type:complete
MNKDPESQLDLLTGMRREDILLHAKEVDYGKFTMTHLKNDDILINNPPVLPRSNMTFSLFTNFSWAYGYEAKFDKKKLVSYDIYDVCYDDDDKLRWVKRNYKEEMEKPIKHSRITFNLTNVPHEKLYFFERGFLNKTNFINWNELPWDGEK